MGSKNNPTVPPITPPSSSAVCSYCSPFATPFFIYVEITGGTVPIVGCSKGGYTTYLTGNINGVYVLSQRDGVPCAWDGLFPAKMHEKVYKDSTGELWSERDYDLEIHVSRDGTGYVQVVFSCFDNAFTGYDPVFGTDCVSASVDNLNEEEENWTDGFCDPSTTLENLHVEISVIPPFLYLAIETSFDTRPTSLIENLPSPNGANVIRVVNEIDKTNFKIKLEE